ncbi:MULTISPECIES: FeoA family protein [unclassified Okeania]|uniref:FeoA family protein n=1 Tax=unclassified Okeania TaxID=2634635 RepID=UPI0013BB9680|nr:MULTISPECIES: FeoA family protein [unclassified Okeania]NES76555.1 ferrous iron transport protein A [Okeania sp. SIO1H4]NET14852.1 ferrous iron transport protein A [Okeania sp. SIO1H6]NET20255.1 ferrous iron transport protein A [Okeania sp. SIO1H5]NET96408.1 ferrous iron transport protein A [Okeania sp. SIO1H2]
MNLSDLKTGQIAIVDRIISSDDTRRIVQRLKEKGVVSNKPVQVLREAKFSSPLHIRVGSSQEINIQPEEAEMIIVKTDISAKDMNPDSTTELTEQVKTASLVSLTTIILVVISGFYRILITRDIYQQNEAKVVTNVVYNSSSTKTKNQRLETVDKSQVQPTMVGSIETVNKKSEFPEKAGKKNNQNTNNHVKATTNSPPQNIEPIAKKITNKTELLELKQKLYNTIDKTWKTPINITSIYLVKVDKNGAIAAYEPFNQIATDNLEKTSIPSLVNSDATTQKELLKTEWAEFTVLFYDNGILEVQSQ